MVVACCVYGHRFDKLSKHRFKFNAQLTDPEAHYKMNNAERRKVEATVAALDRAMGDTSEVVKLRLDEVDVRDTFLCCASIMLGHALWACN